MPWYYNITHTTLSYAYIVNFVVNKEMTIVFLYYCHRTSSLCSSFRIHIFPLYYPLIKLLPSFFILQFLELFHIPLCQNDTRSKILYQFPSHCSLSSAYMRILKILKSLCEIIKFSVKNEYNTNILSQFWSNYSYKLTSKIVYNIICPDVSGHIADLIVSLQ